MKIFIITTIFPPEPVVGAQTAISLANGLVAAGHSVKVITSFPSRPGGKLYPGFKKHFFQREQHPGGFEVVRCFSIPSRKSTLISRFKENIAFGVSSSLFILFSQPADLIHSNVWPIFASSLVSLSAKLRGIPYIIRVTDLYPESLILQKRSGISRGVFAVLRAIDRWVAAGAAQVTVLIDAFATAYREDRGIPPERISVIPDWVEGDLDVIDDEKARDIRRRFCIPDDSFLVGYGGNIGFAAGVETLIEASAKISGIFTLIAGEGSQLYNCQKLAAELNPEKILFLTPWPKEETRALYQAADVLVLPTHGRQSIASIPSKLIRYMLSARPIIATSLPGTELSNLIERAQCGWVVPPDDPDALAEAIVQTQDIGALERSRRGLSGREYAMKYLTADYALPKLMNLIQNSVKE